MPDEEFRCEVCGRNFDTQRGLSSHQTQSHPDMDEETEDKAESGEEDNKETGAGKDNQIDISLGLREVAAIFLLAGFIAGFIAGSLAGGFSLTQEAPKTDNSQDEGNIELVTELDDNVEYGTAEGQINWEKGTVDVDGRPYLGSSDAPVKMVAYEDFFCPYCNRHNTQTLPTIMENYIQEGKVQYFYKHLPVVGGSAPAIASECASRQSEEAFWIFKDFHHTNFKELRELYNKDQDEYQTQMMRWAEATGLDEDKFKSCYENKETQNVINQDMEEAKELGAEATPWNFINGEEIRGAQSYETFKQVIDNQLN